MTKGTKIGLVVGIAAILLIVLVMNSQPKVVSTNTNSSGAGYLNGLFALGAGLGKALTSPAPATPSVYDSAPGKVTDDSSFTTQEQKDAANALSATPFFGSVF